MTQNLVHARKAQKKHTLAEKRKREKQARNESDCVCLMMVKRIVEASHLLPFLLRARTLSFHVFRQLFFFPACVLCLGVFFTRAPSCVFGEKNVSAQPRREKKKKKGEKSENLMREKRFFCAIFFLKKKKNKNNNKLLQNARSQIG